MSMRVRYLICLGLFFLVFPLISGCGGGGGGGGIDPGPDPFADYDGDGIANTADACLGTKEGVLVDADGCSAHQLAGQVTAGFAHTCAMTTADGIKCWGHNLQGQLGTGIINLQFSTTPLAVLNREDGVARVSAGGQHTCALTFDGGVMCWGDNGLGQLGDGGTADSDVSGDVIGLTSGVDDMVAGSYHSCAITDAGEMRCWGDGYLGKLGDGGTVIRREPVPVTGLAGAVAVAGGENHTCAVTDAGGVVCWGWNQYGQLGTGDYIDSTVPVDVPSLASGVVAVTAGSTHTCALTGTGQVRCWGQNGWGQVGDGTFNDTNVPVTVAGLTGIVAVEGGAYHTCAVTDIGGITCWGRNDFGQLGNGANDDSTVPVAVSGLDSGMKAVAGGSFHSCALAADRGVVCWGHNSSGQLGDGTTDHSTFPVAVVGLP